ncbi:MAG TPA: SAM-dependent methyltransferase [Candidatus Thermoplasmatota archaeon]|nr:SAM-dependent methyltransferase [Candidatus Thermoplasmatota archaeon]
MTPAEEAIRAEIERAGGRIPFSRFMELCLYHPAHGYYVRRGPGRDFYTAPQATPVFGELLCRQLAEMWQRLGSPSRFDVVDVGAGKGELLDAIYEEARRTPGFSEAFCPVAVEPHGKLSRGKTLEQIPKESLTGCVLSNELFDAQPVHRLRAVRGAWREVHVIVRDGKLRSVLGDLTPEARAYLAWMGIEPADGLQLEVAPGAPALLRRVAALLSRGYVLTIDYGATTPELLERGSTLRCFFAHRPGDDPLAEPGEQDLTADVDFASLEKAGEEEGLVNLGLVSQGRFLLALGGAERVVASADAGTQLALKNLLHPAGMGERFRVLVQAKRAPGPLTGLRPLG